MVDRTGLLANFLRKMTNTTMISKEQESCSASRKLDLEGKLDERGISTREPFY